MKTIYNLYKKRLIEISGKNRSLFSKKINNKYSFDIGRTLEGDYEAISNFVDFLWQGKMKSFRIIGKQQTSRLVKNFGIEKQVEKKLQTKKNNHIEINKDKELKDCTKKLLINQVSDLKTLKRETLELETETGRYELFVGYPFVEGYLNSDTLIKAPLILFPVIIDIIDEQTAEIQLKQNETVELNKVLLFAYANEHNLDIENLETNFECLSSQGFKDIDDILKYLNTFGIKFSYSERKGIYNFEKTKEPTINSSLTIKHYAVIGRFPLANSIYNDYCALEKEKFTTPAISELFENKKVKKIKNFSSQIYTVNNLDYAQESAIKEVNENGNMVIYGPPGTGKSQTIVNIISDAIIKGKKVLVVSQKKAALDVVFNRLGNLKNKTMFITDVNKKKSEFYSKTKTAHENIMASKKHDLQNDFSEIQSCIDNELMQLENISKVLFDKTDFGLSLQEMYACSEMIGKNSSDYVLYKNLSQNTNLMKLNYIEFSNALRLIKEKRKDELYYRFKEMYNENPLIDAINYNVDIHTLNQSKSLLSKVINSKSLNNNIINNLYAREILSAYVTNINQNNDFEIDNLIKYIATLNNPKLYKKLKLSKLFLPTYMICKFKTNKIEKSLKQSLNQTLLYVKNFVKEYEVLSNTLTPKSYLYFLDNVLCGNIAQLKPLESVICNYVEIRDINSALSDLSDDEKNILEFAYDNSKNLKNFLLIINNILNLRTYHEIVSLEDKYKNQLAKLMDYGNIKNRVLSLKNEQIFISRNLCKEKFNNDYIDFFQNDKESKNFLYQITKQQNLWAIRKTMSMYSQFLFALFPCWLLSPETVSEILPLKKEMFDIVVFDEASQVFIENALPTIYRGKNIVIAGDSKQLRPTSTFAKRYMCNDETDDYSLQAALEVESLLDLAVSRYSSTNLTYHYRSKNEELINFSNFAFYDGKLQIAPDLTKNKEIRPIQRIKVKGMWVDRKNIVEANEVAKLLHKTSKTNRHQNTIGVIAFNNEQENAIEDAIDSLCKKDLEFKKYILEEKNRKEDGQDVGLFIKNLENVQGDERDIIIFSIGYAKNEFGKVACHFGSLSAPGGENRLNVAITRAKEKIYVITSIEPDDLDVDNSKNIGPKYLKSYLNYIKAVSCGDEKNQKKIISNLTKNTKLVGCEIPQNIETQIAYELSKAGYTVDTNIGNTEYKISVAVYDENHDRYIYGIECDYSAYNSSSSVLERDVYYPNFLKSRGWNITRVWSRDWWLNKNKVINTLIKEIEKIKNKSCIKSENISKNMQTNKIGQFAMFYEEISVNNSSALNKKVLQIN